ncbi:UNVERIFIED_ORG: hypothetical protein [Escherichia phage CMSTMSU]
MHENLEYRLDGKPDHQGGMPIRVLARKMADKIQEEAWPRINEVWVRKFLYSMKDYGLEQLT